MLYSMLTLIFKFSFKLNCFNELNTDLFTLKFNADISKYFVYLHVELWLHKTLNDVILKWNEKHKEWKDKTIYPKPLMFSFFNNKSMM